MEYEKKPKQEKLDAETLEIVQSEGQYAISENPDKSILEPKVSDIPEYRVSLQLDEAQVERLSAQVKREFKTLRDERSALKLQEKWDERDRQYDGELKPNKKLNFNLHCHQSKIKEDAVVRALNEAFLDADPIIDVTPRPENMKQGGQDVCEKQALFIDYEMDGNVS